MKYYGIKSKIFWLVFRTEEKKQNLEKNSKSLSLDTKTKDIPTKNVDVKSYTNKEVPKKDELSKVLKLETSQLIKI